MVGSGFGGAGQRQQPVGERGPALRAGPVRVGVRAQRGLRLQQQSLRHADLGLGADACRDQCDEVAGLQLGLTRHLPCRRPGQRAGERFGDVGDARQRRLQRLRVQSQRAVGQVVVVDQDQLAAGNTLQRRNFDELTFDVELFAVHPHQLAGAVVVVDADRQPVHAGFAFAWFCAALADGEAAEPAVGVDVEVGAQRVEPGGLQPLAAPVRQVAAGGLLKRAEQVTEGGVVERVRRGSSRAARPGSGRGRRRPPTA